MRLTIGKKLFSTFAITFALVMANAAIVYFKVADLRARQLSVSKVRIPAMEAVDDIRIADQRMVNGLYGSIYLRSDKTAGEANVKQIAQSRQRTIEDLALLGKFSAQFKNIDYDKRIAEISDRLAHLIATSDQIANQNKGRAGVSAAAVHLLLADAIPTANKVRDMSKDLIAKVNESTDADNVALDKSGGVILWTLWLSTGAVLLLGGAACWKITGGIVRPLSAVVSRAESIAAGDLLGAELRLASNDEVASLTTAVNKMQRSLARTLQAVASAAENVAAASEQISASAGEMATGSDTQKDQVRQIAVALKAMSAAVRNISENSRSAANLASTASEAAHDGGKIVGETLTSVQSLASFIQEAAGNVAELGGRSKQIGKIVGVIHDIADQTNLLALNAAIEAARAGEQGRGFAVVADEVRKLAERTGKATKEIADMIKAMRSETAAAVRKMQSGNEQVERGLAATGRAGKSLEQIIEKAGSVGEMVGQIAAATTEQSATTDEINGSMERISQLVAESANGARQSARACERLSASAAQMQHLVAQFTLAGSARHSVEAVAPSQSVALIRRSVKGAAAGSGKFSG
jgi:methyl-accepting chemotaxis protein